MLVFWKSLGQNSRLALLVVLIFLVWMATGVFKGAPEEKKEQQQEVNGPAQVAVQEIVAEDFTPSITLMGRTATDDHVELVAQVAGRIVATPVEQGETVAAGDIVVQIETAGREAAVKAAKAQVKAAEVLVKAARRLSTEGFKAASTMADREASLASAQQALAEAELNLARTKLTSPVAARVDNLAVDVGDTVTIGDAVATLIGTQTYLVVGQAAQREQKEMKVGQKAMARLANEQEVEGVIRFVAQEADERTLTYRVEMAVDGASYQVPVGMAAALNIPGEGGVAHQIPHVAVVLDDDGALNVMTATDGFARKKAVQLLQEGDRGLWVTGLTGTEQVLVRGQLSVADGQSVSATVVK